MKPEIVSFEANLLFKAAVPGIPAGLVEDIRSVASPLGVKVISASEIDERVMLITCDTMEILIGIIDTALPPIHFLQSSRPAAACVDEAAILSRLVRTQSHATILVADLDGGAPDDPDHAATKRRMCWDLAACLLADVRPELVFWCETDTLYAVEEFERACAFLASQENWAGLDALALPSRAPALFRLEPILPDRALEWMETSLPVRSEPESMLSPPPGQRGELVGISALDTVASVTLPTRAMSGLDRLQSNWDTRRVVRGLAAACSAATIVLCSQTNLPSLFM